jgi:branched-chain amino acid transport system substrate-binding protein
MGQTRKWIVITGLLWFVASSVSFAAEPVRLGFIYIFSGRAALHGEVAKQGAELAMAEINQAGGIAGREVIGIFEDSQAKPEVGVQAARKLVAKDKVDAVIGIISSDVAPAVSAAMNEMKTPLIITTAANPVVTGARCNRYTFRVTPNSQQLMKATALLARHLKAKRWTTIGPDYALGHGSWKAFKKYLAEVNPGSQFAPDPEVLFAPLGTTDWKPQIDKLMTADADGILVTLWGGNFMDFVRQAQGVGFFKKNRLLIAPIVGTYELLNLGVDMPKGLWISSSYWPLADPKGADKSFVQAYMAQYGSPPGYVTMFAYSGVKAYAQAAQVAGSTDKEAIVKALEGLSVNSPVGTIAIRAEDHQGISDLIAGKISDETALTSRRRPYRTLESVILFPGSEVSPSIEETECKMK